MIFGLSLIDFVVIALFLGGTTLIGLRTAKRVHSLSDFAMPRTFGKLMMIFFSFGTGTNSDQAVSVAGKTVTNGISGIWYSWLHIFTTPFFWIIAPAFRRLRATTTADVFEARFGRSLALLYAFLGFVKLTFSIGLSLKGGSIMLEALTGGALPGTWAILVLTILFVLYGVAGGLSAAIVTDFVQGIFTLSFSFMLLPFIWSAVGGIDGIRAGVDDPNFFSLFAPGEIDVFFVAMFAVLSLLMVFGAPQTMANCGAGKDEMDGAVGFMVGTFIKRICTVAWALVGMAAVVYFADRDFDPEQAYGMVAREFLPTVGWGLLGLFIAAMMAGMMSTCDTLMVSASALFAQNLYRPLVPGKSTAHYLWIVRLASVLIVVGGIIIAYLLPGFVTGLEIYLRMSSIIGLPLFLGMIWRRTTVAGAWASVLGAYAVWMLCTVPAVTAWAAVIPGTVDAGIVRENGGGAWAIHMPWQILFYLSGGFFLGIVVSLFSREVPREKLDLFFSLLRTPIHPEEVLKEPCTLPEGSIVPAPHYLFPGTGIELLVPGRRTIVGFLAGCAGVAALIGSVVWIVG